MYQKVEICGINTAKLPILSEKEKKSLIAKAQSGDAEARRQMIEGNLRLVLSVVQKFSQRGENMDDLFQVGCIGLMKAIDHFDPSLEVRFSTYGVPMIIGEIRRFLRDNNSVRVSRSMRDVAYKALGAREALEKELGHEPSVAQISAYVGLSTRTVSLAMESVIEPVSLYEPIYNDGGDTVFVMDQVSDDGGEDSWISGIQFRENVRALTPREKHIMQLRYLVGKTQMEVAAEVGVSQAQVSRLEKSAMKQIKSGECEI
ncbi:MAG: RNA polymerase sporulation sigma factor SigG [Faecalibacterium sp.]